MGIGSPRTDVSRCRALASIPGVVVQEFDSKHALGDSFWAIRINRRLYLAQSIRRANASLIVTVKTIRPDYVVVDGEVWLYPSTLQEIKKHTGSVVYYATDDAMARPSHLWLHRLAIKHYDLYLTTNRFNISELRDRYGVKTMRVGMGYDHDYYHKPTTGRDCGNQSQGPILFVGHWEPHTESYVSALLHAGHAVSLHGAGWKRAKNAALRGAQPMPGNEYIMAISNASIALCFLSRMNRNESTGRSYEITGMRTFMLAERTDEHQYLFGDGIGAGLFSNTAELIEKAGYYLQHPTERQLVAAQGYIRCNQLGLSWQEHMYREWPLAQRVLEYGTDSLSEADEYPFWSGFRHGKAIKS
jgi:hypothetical protein